MSSKNDRRSAFNKRRISYIHAISEKSKSISTDSADNDNRRTRTKSIIAIDANPNVLELLNLTGDSNAAMRIDSSADEIEATDSFKNNKEPKLVQQQPTPTLPRRRMSVAYEQVSVREILSRVRSEPDKSTNKVDQEKARQRQRQQQEQAISTVQGELTSRHDKTEDYLIEMPKSGLIDREEFLTPIYLPTGCEKNTENETDSGASSNENKSSQNDLNASKNSMDSVIRNMVYCSDKMELKRYHQQHGAGMSSGRNSMQQAQFGLRFESNFENGNLYRADNLIRRGSAALHVGAPEEYELYMQADPCLSHLLPAPIPTPPSAATTTSNSSSNSNSSMKAMRTHCCQWFFFRVSNTKKRAYRFHIRNFTRYLPALQHGMQPVMISEKNYQQFGKGWERVGTDVTFIWNKSLTPKNPNGTVGNNNNNNNRRGSSNVPRRSSSNIAGAISMDPLFTICGGGNEDSFTYSFTIKMPNAKDTIYLAFAPPYTNTQLQNMLYTLSNPTKATQQQQQQQQQSSVRSHSEDAGDDSARSKNLTIRPLCRTVAGNRCDIVIITENKQLEKENIQSGSLFYNNNSSSNNNSDTTTDMLVEDFINNRPVSTRLTAISSNTTTENNERIMEQMIPSATTPRKKMNRNNESSSNNMVDFNAIDAEQGSDALPSFLRKMQQKIQLEKEVHTKQKIHDKRKQFIFMFARAHAGETVSSWMCEGIIKFLLGDSPIAVQLRRHFVFCIVPLLNPDGVINGFNRYNIAGFDLSQCWQNPSALMQPTVFYLKKLIRFVSAVDTVVSVIELKGQAVREGMFLYGAIPSKTEAEVYEAQLHEIQIANSTTISTSGSKSFATRSSMNSTSQSVDLSSNASTVVSQQKHDARTLFTFVADRCESMVLKNCAITESKDDKRSKQQQHYHNHSHGSVSLGGELPIGGHRKPFKTGSACMVFARDFYVPLSVVVYASFHSSRELSRKFASYEQMSSPDYAR